jgi:1-acyl-sn-glycerol-3-phosphate acyltransferase
MIALRCGVTVLPMAVVGSHVAMPKGAKFPKRYPVTVRIGTPFSVPKIEGRLDRAVLDEYSQKLIDGIASLLPADQLPVVPALVSASRNAARVPTTPQGGP